MTFGREIGNIGWNIWNDITIALGSEQGYD